MEKYRVGRKFQIPGHEEKGCGHVGKIVGIYDNYIAVKCEEYHKIDPMTGEPFNIKKPKKTYSSILGFFHKYRKSEEKEGKQLTFLIKNK